MGNLGKLCEITKIPGNYMILKEITGSHPGAWGRLKLQNTSHSKKRCGRCNRKKL